MENQVDLKKVKEFYETGEKSKIYKMAEIYYEGITIKENVGNTLLLLEFLAERKELQAIKNLLFIYKEGKKVKRDEKKIKELYKLVEEIGTEECHCFLLSQYLNENLIPSYFLKAIQAIPTMQQGTLTQVMNFLKRKEEESTRFDDSSSSQLDFQSSLDSLTSIIHQLKKEKEQSKKSIQILQQEKSELNDKIVDLSLHNDKLEKENARLAKQIDSLNESQRIIEKSLIFEKNNNSLQQHHIDRLQSMLEEANQIITSLNYQNVGLSDVNSFHSNQQYKLNLDSLDLQIKSRLVIDNLQKDRIIQDHSALIEDLENQIENKNKIIIRLNKKKTN